MNNTIKKQLSVMKTYIPNMKTCIPKMNTLDTILTLCSLLTILYDYTIPNEIASLIDNDVTQILLYLSGLSLFIYSSPLIAILVLIACNILINKASLITGSHYLNDINNSEKTKSNYIKSLDHNDSVTLEEEMVEIRAPLVRNKPVLNANYKPILEETHNASDLTEND